MPHIQIRVKPALSPADVDGPLGRIADLQNPRVNIRGIGGSDHEFNGEIGLMLEDDDVDRVLDTLSDYQPRSVTDIDGLHLDYVRHEAGGLLEAVRRARRHHPRGVVSDIAVGLDQMSFSVDGNGDAIRDQAGCPVFDGGGTAVDAHPVQIFFVLTASRDDEGVIIP